MSDESFRKLSLIKSKLNLSLRKHGPYKYNNAYKRLTLITLEECIDTLRIELKNNKISKKNNWLIWLVFKIFKYFLKLKNFWRRIYE